jgi:hypothetical protein
MGKLSHGGGETMPIAVHILEPLPRRDRVCQAAVGQDLPQIPLVSREDGTASKVPFVIFFLVDSEGYRMPQTHVEAICELRASGGYSSHRNDERAMVR